MLPSSENPTEIPHPPSPAHLRLIGPPVQVQSQYERGTDGVVISSDLPINQASTRPPYTSPGASRIDLLAFMEIIICAYCGDNNIESNQAHYLIILVRKSPHNVSFFHQQPGYRGWRCCCILVVSNEYKCIFRRQRHRIQSDSIPDFRSCGAVVARVIPVMRTSTRSSVQIGSASSF